MAGAVLDGYIAFGETDTRANKVMEIYALNRTMFGAPFDYLPFAHTVTDSVLKALTGRVNCPQVAEEQSTWQVLRIIMSAEKVTEAFKAGLLVHVKGINGYTPPGWRYYEDLSLIHISEPTRPY